MATTWHQTLRSEYHDSAWDRIKAAIRRDWEQTKHDLHIEGSRELNQGMVDTINQAMGRQAIPAGDRPNPSRLATLRRRRSDDPARRDLIETRFRAPREPAEAAPRPREAK